MFLGIVISCVTYIYGTPGGLCLETFLFLIDNLLSSLTDSNTNKPALDAEAAAKLDDWLRKAWERVHERSSNVDDLFIENEEFLRATDLLLKETIYGDPISTIDQELINRVTKALSSDKSLTAINNNYALEAYLDQINLNNYNREVARIVYKIGAKYGATVYHESIFRYMNDLFDENIYCFMNGVNIEELNPYMNCVNSVYIIEETIMELTNTEKIVIENINRKFVYLNGEYPFVENIYRFVNNEKIAGMENIYTDFPLLVSSIAENPLLSVCNRMSPSPYFNESTFLRKEGILDLGLDLDALEYHFF